MLSTLLLTALTFPLLAMNQVPALPWSEPKQLAIHDMPLNDRYPVPSVNKVFKDNILLTLSYLDGTVKSKQDINWENIQKPVTFQFRLQPNQTFAFHDGVLPEYKDNVQITTAAHFGYSDGFESDGYLTGDGVCHLASLINWTAQDAGLKSVAPTNHNFANIPDVPRQYGTSIYYNPGSDYSNAHQNLYVTNTLDKPVTFKFDYSNDDLKFSIIEDN